MGADDFVKTRFTQWLKDGRTNKSLLSKEKNGQTGIPVIEYLIDLGHPHAINTTSVCDNKVADLGD